ncbi:MAG: YbgC/FadM family acyl-CoA thioesterase [Gammaproteobacteria bacterium]|jgi:acyl-CoA thioester hydrolase|tara:strand:- start:1161 stop:1568 length:408 start_codon:yes stop_codon:yes gene_type:complete
MNKIIKCNDLNITIYIEDTDFQGFVYHANYLKFFERARSDFLSSNKISQKTLRINNLAFVVKKINLNYVSAAELGDDLIIKTSVEKKSDARMIFSQKIINSSNKNFVDGTIEICLINLITKKPQKFPDDLLLIFE